MKTQIFGILNITPDSFSDAGVNFNFNSAVQSAKRMIQKNVFAIDVGAESTRPNAKIISIDEEITRLERVVPKLTKLHSNISLDTRNYETAKWGILNGIKIINDVCGLKDERMMELVAKHNIVACFMHSLTVPANPQVVMQGDDILSDLMHFAQNKIKECKSFGIPLDNLIFDVGIGFGKTAEQSIFLMKNIEYFKDLGVKLLVGHSRKSFLRLAFKEKFEKSEPTLEEKDRMTEVFSNLMHGKVDFLRLHL